MQSVKPNQQSKKISILIADDHPLMRKALRVTLENEPDIVIVGEAADGQEALELSNRLCPDLIIMDVTMPKMNGIEATRRVKAGNPNIAVLALTVHDDTEHIMGMLDAGAAGYVTKSIFDEELVKSVRAVVSGETVIGPPVLKEVLQHALKYMGKPEPVKTKNKLSARDLEILKLAAKGLNNKNIASELNLSPLTVKVYMVEIFSKLNVASRTEAVITALKTGLLTIDDIS
jgi:DNA-binding NarL/FixJ family response regulator